MRLTDLLDVPAFVSSCCNRLRWQVEWFFRGLQVLAGCGHDTERASKAPSVFNLVAVLMALLSTLQTGARSFSQM